MNLSVCFFSLYFSKFFTEIFSGMQVSVLISCPDSLPKVLGPLKRLVKAAGHLVPRLPGVRELSLVPVSTRQLLCPAQVHWLAGILPPKLPPNSLLLPPSIFLLPSSNKNTYLHFSFWTTQDFLGKNLTFYLEFNFLNLLSLFGIPIIPILFVAQLMKLLTRRRRRKCDDSEEEK